MIVKIPFSEIERVDIYINQYKKPLTEIVEEQKPDLAVTGVFYDPRTWRPVCPVKANGTILCADKQYNYLSISWDTGDDAAAVLIPPGGACGKRNYAANCLLVEQGRAKEPLYYNVDVGGKRGRVAVGLTSDGWIFWASQDGTDSARSPEELRGEMAALGCETAIMMDGGGKVNVYHRKSGVLWEGRDPSQTLLLIWTKEEKTMKKVMLDPGHDAGNVNGSPDGTYKEHEFALDMGKRIKAILEKAGVAVSMTRTNGSAVSLDERCRMANAIKDLDLYVSLHSNAADSSGQWSSARGWSAHIVAKGGNAEKAAKAILKRAQEAGVEVRSQSIVVSNFQVLRDTVAPAVLIEHGFHTNEQDVSLLKDSQYRQALASAEALGILDHLGISFPTEGAPDKAADWADEAWEWAFANKILDGTRPFDNMTRQELATVLYRTRKE